MHILIDALVRHYFASIGIKFDSCSNWKNCLFPCKLQGYNNGIHVLENNVFGLPPSILERDDKYYYEIIVEPVFGSVETHDMERAYIEQQAEESQKDKPACKHVGANETNSEINEMILTAWSKSKLLNLKLRRMHNYDDICSTFDTVIAECNVPFDPSF